MDFDGAATVFNDFLTNCEAHAETVWVRVLSSLHLAEKREKLPHFFLLNAFACVDDLHLQEFIFEVVSCANEDAPSVREFKSVLCQVD